MRKLKFLGLGLVLLTLAFSLQSCGEPSLIRSALSSRYMAYEPNNKATKNIQQIYNPALDTQKQYPIGKVDVIFTDVAFKISSLGAGWFILSGYNYAPGGSEYLTDKTKETILSYAKESMPNIDFVIKDRPDFNSKNPQLIFFVSYFNKQKLGVITYNFTPYIINQAVLYADNKYYLINNSLYESPYLIGSYKILDNSLTYAIYYPIFPTVKAILLQVQNQQPSPYLESWLNAVKQWQPSPVGDNKMAFKVTDTPKLPCVYNYDWTSHKKDAQGKEYGKNEPEWYQNLKGIAPYLFMPENSPECQAIEKNVKDNDEITQAIMLVVAKKWEDETKPIISNWDKYSKLTVGAGNATSVAKASE